MESDNKIKKVDEAEVKHVTETLSEVKKEISKVFFTQEEITNSFLRAVLCDGHILVEGVPGIAKTLAIKALAQVSGCTSKRIQFTVDLLPSDILGLTIYDPKRGFEIVKGPIFANFIIADEINRSP
ncbi:MAG: AAA family ATPase, partial [Nanoarchaeota archaeon]|nr:AAA family ATPase [Nanoarchaeota archaeon]